MFIQSRRFNQFSQTILVGHSITQSLSHSVDPVLREQVNHAFMSKQTTAVGQTPKPLSFPGTNQAHKYSYHTCIHICIYTYWAGVLCVHMYFVNFATTWVPPRAEAVRPVTCELNELRLHLKRTRRSFFASAFTTPCCCSYCLLLEVRKAVLLSDAKAE